MKYKLILALALVIMIVIAFSPALSYITLSEGNATQQNDSPGEGTDHKTGGGDEEKEISMQKANPELGLAAGAENEHLVLYFDNTTGGIAVRDKASGKMFYSNPPTAKEDQKTSDETKQQLMSQVELVYNIKGKEGDFSLNSYSQALLLEQVSWGKIENGIRVSMTIGRAEQRLLLPKQIGKTSFEENILGKIKSERQKKQMQAFYILNPKEEMPGAVEDVYTLKTSANDRDKRVLEEIVKSTGYTYEMLEQDYEAIGYEPEKAVFPSFSMDIDYILQGNSLTVQLDAGNIVYDEDTFNLVSLSLLKYFGAGETREKGWIFLPDGSGTLIGFNNDGTKKTLLTTGKVYGDDSAVTRFERGSIKQDFRFPVFGIHRGDSTLLAIIDDGDAVADINGMMGGINHSWNTAYANFTIRNKDKFIEENAFEQAPWIIYEKKPYKGNITLKYYFLVGDDADYPGMAKAYRNYLIEKGALKKITAGDNIPFYLETLGSIDMIVRKLGLPISTQVPITTFEQAEGMINRLSQRGVDNIKLRYKAWYNGGYYYTAPSKMKVEKVIGGAGGLSELSKKAQAMGAEVYPDVDFVHVPSSSMFDGFSPRKDSIRNLFQKTAFYAELDPVEQAYMNIMWCITPNRIPEYFNRFSKAYDKLNIRSFSLSTLGKSLYSDFKSNNQINRQEAKDYFVKVLKAASEKYENIISDYGNAYIYPYADHLLNLPEEDSSFLISDKQVPFIQIALHGYIPYAGQALNLANEVRPAMLKAIEYGNGAYFVLNHGEDSILKAAGVYNQQGSMNFSYWEEEAADIYARMNEALRDVQDQAITDHKEVADQVFVTTYENGKSIIVNYSSQKASFKGVTVQPLDFAVIKD
ncbi:hypothetical protein CDQ84_07575 [Clostridium thermosuccinogenes]|uniref:Uncharacterized protein n=1 Tax=Clostridium thermosuccinogenes TaxID=84032 RepID=A0A2K2FM17_9CLOT|nr:DUF5696 domain-containing protein [Pseudoclostridium thermosuccinogenes]AUS95930.1 hypothetical protein CDO33_05430 [Pseudoclostridium thermosuccinogenes]PNT97883.1 hypothetical protein CDQ85_07075 [Pseudoclostridium thermosuccinogenes]PNT99815.1 hypothetical protein CDQ84_07575 [Pseudoclostridium thermosuccinogenes]